MYDELVKKIRHCATDPMHCLSCVEDKDGRCFARLMTQAADAIEELSAIRDEQKAQIILMAAEIEEQQPRWIPVTERLPEIEEDVLIAATVHTKKGDVRAVTGDFINTAGQWNSASCSWRYEVTHWMPLPQPPKDE